MTSLAAYPSPADLATRMALHLARRIGRRSLADARRRTRWLGAPMRRLMRRRAAIVRRNLELCFPDRSSEWREAVAREHFGLLAETAAEIAVCWTRRASLDDRAGEIIGLEHLDAARRDSGVVLLTGHFTSLELGGRLVAERVPVGGVYRPLRNARLNAFQNEGRARYAGPMLARDDLRGMVRHLRGGGVLWYAPDQDFGPDRSRFAPFFDVPTATLKGLPNLARMGRAQVVPMAVIKSPDSGRVIVHLERAWSAEPDRMLERYNAFLERHVRAAPAQYWWVHRRFKTAPQGAPPRYPR